MSTNKRMEIGIYTFGDIGPDPITGRTITVQDRVKAKEIELLATEIAPIVRKETSK